MKEIEIHAIVEHLADSKYVGDPNVKITSLVDILNETPMSSEQLGWCSDKHILKLENMLAGTVIISEASVEMVKNNQLNYIVVSKPRQSFKEILEAFFVEKRQHSCVAKSAFIHGDVRIPERTFVGENVVIESGCIVGNNVYIGHNTVIHSNTVISDNVTIGCNNTIGGVGFGYEKNGVGEWEVMPHVGNVVIKNNVEIGNNNCIDRAVLGSTVIGVNVKIDNLVHVAHGVKIEENSLIIAHAMLGGSAKIGRNVWIGPNASIINHGSVEDNSLVGMSAVVIKPVGANSIVAGSPARFLKENTR